MQKQNVTLSFCFESCILYIAMSKTNNCVLPYMSIVHIAFNPLLKNSVDPDHQKAADRDPHCAHNESISIMKMHHI